MLYRYIVLLLVIAAITKQSHAQQSKIDSLVNVLKTQKEDTSKANTLNALSRQLWQTGNYAEAKKYADEALALSEKIKFNTGKANAYNNVAIVYAHLGNYTEALKYHLVTLRISEETGYKKLIAESHNGIAAVYWNQANYPEALKNLIYSLEMQKEIGDKKGIATSLNNIGKILTNQGNYPEALKNHFASLKISEQIGDKKGVASSYSSIGGIYEGQSNYPDALKNQLASLKIKEEIGDRLGIATSYNSIGSIYSNEGKYAEALQNCFTSLKLNKEIAYKKGIGNSHNSIGLIYEKQKNHTDALKNHLASLKIREEMGDKKGIACSFINIGQSLINLRNFAEAKRFLNDGLLLSIKIQSKDDIKVSYERLARVDSAMGNWDDAYKNHKLFILYRDSLVNEESSKKITETQMKYEFDKKEDSLNYQQILTNEKLKQQTLLAQQQEQSLLLKEKEFALMSNEQQLQQLQIEKSQADFAAQKAVQKIEADNKQGQLLLANKEKAIQSLELNKEKQVKNYLLAGLVLFALLSFFIYRNYRNRQNLKLLTLRNKIASDLHDDVGSTLSSISIFSQMAQQQSKEVIPMLETIGESSRKMLDAMADIVWTINPENDQFEKIILRMRSFAYELLGAKNIDFEFIADDVSKMKLPMNVRKNLYLIFKEATNNMVKYSEADKVLFTVKEEKNNLIMQICDNGKGFDTHKSTVGNGLKNMKKRAEEIGGFFLLDSLPGKGTTVKLSVAI
ncbi:MAG: tetratricopeptide repeat protein [Chitinophagaceae bacterium]